MEEDPKITLGHREPTQIVWLFLPEMLLSFLSLETMNFDLGNIGISHIIGW